MKQEEIKLILKQQKELEKIKLEYDKEGLIILKELINIYLDEVKKDIRFHKLEKAEVKEARDCKFKEDNVDWDWKPIENGNKVPTYQLVPKIKECKSPEIKESIIPTSKPINKTYKNGKPKSQSRYMIKKYGKQLSACENDDGSVKSLD